MWVAGVKWSAAYALQVLCSRQTDRQTDKGIFLSFQAGSDWFSPSALSGPLGS